jgi:hypothetical protein
MATFGTFVDNVSLKASELNDCFKLTSFSPVVRQSVVVDQTNNSKGSYFQVNKIVICSIRCPFQSSGTLNSRIELDLPVTAASSSVRVIGGGRIRDVTLNDFLLLRAVQISTTRVAFLSDTTNSLSTYLGQTDGPNMQLENGDNLIIYLMYEAA